MRGGVSINDLLYLYSHDDREAIRKVVEDNIELSKSIQTPVL